MHEDTKVQTTFRNHNDSVHSYEESQRKSIEHWERRAKNREHRVTNIASIFPELRIDRSALEAAMEWEKTQLDQRLTTIRAEFSSRSREADHASRNSFLFRDTKRLTIPLFAATLMADDHDQFKHIKGERGNPWIMPDNPSEVNVKVSSTGMGDAFVLWGGPTFNTLRTAQVDLWFLFWPDVSALWNLTAVIDLFGYYYLRANDETLTSKWARAKVTAHTGVYQYFWSGVRQFGLLDKEDDNIDEGFLFDRDGWFDTSGFLRANDPAVFRLRLDLSVEAKGAGSYAEVNFSDGSANFIKPLVLLAGPS